MSKIFIIALIFLAVVFALLPIKYPTSINSRGKLLPYKTWTLSKGEDGRLLTELSDNLKGLKNSISITQFERGDAVEFKLNAALLAVESIDQGDTIGYVISNEIEKDIQKLRGELKTARASLNVQTSSEKESIIRAEKSRLEFANTELEEQTKIYNRKKKLYEKDLISLQEFEADEARYELAKINISIAEERLRTVTSGAKKEEINFAQSQIKAIENEINVLQRRYESNNIVTPITGMIVRSYSADTLLIVNDTSKKIILIPVKWSESGDVFADQAVLISSSEVRESLTGTVVSIDNTVKTINGGQYVIVTAVSEDRMEVLKPGLNVDCKFIGVEKTIMELITNVLSSVSIY